MSRRQRLIQEGRQLTEARNPARNMIGVEAQGKALLAKVEPLRKEVDALYDELQKKSKAWLRKYGDERPEGLMQIFHAMSILGDAKMRYSRLAHELRDLDRLQTAYAQKQPKNFQDLELAIRTPDEPPAD